MLFLIFISIDRNLGMVNLETKLKREESETNVDQSKTEIESDLDR